MRPGKPSYGESIAAVSGVLLFAFMFFDWYGRRCFNHSNLLFGFSCISQGQSAWDALDYIPSILLLAVFAALVTVTIRLIDPTQKLLRADAAVAALGLISTALILFRILEPPTDNLGHDGLEALITVEGTVQFPIFLALTAATGIALGGGLAIREEWNS